MIAMGLLHVGSAIYLSAIVAFVISVNDNEAPRRIARETARRTGKLLGGLLAIGLVVQLLTWLA
ncbi:MAG: hypothetical protein BWZ10_03486 [candidate division BRC1 bacterium ADurb.BinA364]|nr:MAG: hypothetical protein BWZ10_03486 [candidate division BRC1 bacterium ADurb.BinA364]